MAAVDDLVERARAALHRVTPREAFDQASDGALLVDIRPQAQRAVEGELPGALVIERNVLEWRLDPTSAARIPEATGPDVAILLVCSEGYASSLAAFSLQQVGLSRATDVIGGVAGWRSAGLPLVSAPAPPAPGMPAPGQQAPGQSAGT